MTFPWKRRRVKPEFSKAEKRQFALLADAVSERHKEAVLGVRRCLWCDKVVTDPAEKLCPDDKARWSR